MLCWPEEDAAFDRRMAEIEERFGTGQGEDGKAKKRK